MKYRVKRHEVVQPLDQSYRLIPLTRGQNAIVDAEDFERLSQFNWFAQWCPHTKSFYAKGWQQKKRISMAAAILHCNPDQLVDHRSRDTLDNRKENLRQCTNAENVRNRRIFSTCKSGYKGVSMVPTETGRPWKARMSINGKRFYLGVFSTIEEAARAYDAAALLYHGDFANLNFPHGTTCKKAML